MLQIGENGINGVSLSVKDNNNETIYTMDSAYTKTWPGPIGLAWPQSLPVLTFSLKISVAPNFGLASNLASAKSFGLKYFFYIFVIYLMI